MTEIILAPARPRAGRLACACAPDSSAAARGTGPPAPAQGLVRAAAGFGLTVLSQALTVSILPVAGAVLSPHAFAAGLPFGLTLVGAAAATVPAAGLTSRFGRRAGLALGGSLGVAGAVLTASSLDAGRFPTLLLGSLWLGMGQGFGFFYRHAAALADGAERPRRIALVLGAGSLAAVLAPALMRLAEGLAGPRAPGAALLCLGIVQLGVIALALPMDRDGLASGRDAASRPPGAGAAAGRARVFAVATAAGAAAWFGMALVMAQAPSLLALCRLPTSAASGVVAWHILWMHMPAACLAPLLRRRAPGACIAGGGLTLLAAAIALLQLQRYGFGLGLLLASAGAGWSLAMLGTGIVLHRDRIYGLRALALHDSLQLAAAVAGALVAGWLRP